MYLPTSETFVAQMLNLDLLGGIAFDKGCYTGQEVIARAHYRGRVKRRLQRWHAPPDSRAATWDDRTHRRRTVAHGGARRRSARKAGGNCWRWELSRARAGNGADAAADYGQRRDNG